MFAAGAAEVVTDPKLMKEALARPGVVIRKARGSEAEHVRALGARPTKKKEEAGSRIKSGMTKEEGGSRIESGMTKNKGPRPSRAAVEKAEAAVSQAKARHREAADKLRAAERALEEARKRFRAAMAAWAE